MNFDARRYVLTFFIAIVGFSYIIRIFYMQVIDDKWKLRAQQIAEKRKEIIPARAVIFDRNGKKIVSNRTYFNLMMVEDKIKNLDRKKREKCSYKIKQIHINFIKDELKNNNDIHIQLLHQKLHNKFTDLSICRQYLSNIIRDNNITRKRATFEHFP
mgnify:CR=1 FL=1